MTKAIVFDTETTSKDAPKIIESSYKGVTINDDGTIELEAPVTQRYNTDHPIAWGAMATHHIFPEELVGMPDTSTFKFPEDVEYVIGHQVDFDMDAASNSTGNDYSHIKRIDTLAIARKIYPEADSHSVSALLYMISDDKKSVREMLKNAHSAEADIGFLSDILLPDLLKKAGVKDMEELYAYSEEARVPEVMTFGKHQGTRIEDLPMDYRDWILKKEETMDKYVVIAVKRSLGMSEEPAVKSTSPTTLKL